MNLYGIESCFDQNMILFHKKNYCFLFPCIESQCLDLCVAAEEMIRGLAQVPWERVDVSFQKSRQRYVAHNTIQAWILLLCLPFALLTISD